MTLDVEMIGSYVKTLNLFHMLILLYIVYYMHVKLSLTPPPIDPHHNLLDM